MSFDEDEVLWVRYAGDEKPDDELEDGEYLFATDIESTSQRVVLDTTIKEFLDTCEEVPEWVSEEELRPLFDAALEEAGLDPRRVWFVVRWDTSIE